MRQHTMNTNSLFKSPGISRCAIICILIIVMFIPSTVLAKPDWLVRMKVQSGSAHNYLILGADDAASDDFDNLWETPALFGGGIRAYFPHGNWNRPHAEFWRDIKSNDLGVLKSWPFTVDIDDSALLNTTFTITWDLSKVPQDYTITLTDDMTGQEIDMRATPSYSFIYTSVRTLRVAVTNPGCINQGVRIEGIVPSPYPTIQEAYNAAADSALIHSLKTTLSGDINLNLNKTVTMDGGFDCDYSNNTGATTITGNLVINSGTATIGNMVLQ